MGPTVLHDSEKLLVARSRSRSACHHSDSDSDLEIDCGDFYIYVLLFFTVLLRKKKKTRNNWVDHCVQRGYRKRQKSNLHANYCVAATEWILVIHGAEIQCSSGLQTSTLFFFESDRRIESVILVKRESFFSNGA